MSFRRSRGMTLAVVIWSGLAVAWVLIQWFRVFSKRCGSSDEELFDQIFSGDAVCVDIAAHGGKAALALDLAIRVGIIWAIGVGVLAAIWFIVRDRGPASASVTVASVPASPAAAPVAAPSAPPEGWYADAERPGHTRWWNGSAWGIRDDEHASLSSTSPSTEGDRASAPPADGAPVVAQAGNAAAAVAAEPSTQPEGWYPDAERPGRTRWWNGTAWGMRDDEHSSLAGATPSTDGDGAGGAPAPDDAELVAAAAATSVESSPEAAPAAASSPEPAPTPAQGSPARFCENCGAPRTPTGKFCTACGHA